MNKQKIVLNGQAYVAPKTESVEIINQGVLCASGGGTKGFGLGVGKVGLAFPVSHSLYLFLQLGKRSAD